MEENFDDKKFILPEKLLQYNAMELQANYNAVQTVLNVYSTVYEDVTKIALDIITGRDKTKISKLLRNFYGESSPIYLLDLLLWVSMIQPRDQIHYKDLDHEDWQLFHQNYEKMSLGSDEQLIRSITNFSKQVSIGHATKSKASTFKKGLKQSIMGQVYQTYYFFK